MARVRAGAEAATSPRLARGFKMIGNAHRSGFVRVEPGEESRPNKPQDDVRSGRATESAQKPEGRDFGAPSKKIIEVDGVLRLVDA
jgi:hypothetical protein